MLSRLRRRVGRYVSQRQWLIPAVVTGLLGAGGTALWNRAADTLSTNMSTANGLAGFVIVSCMAVLGMGLYMVRRIEDIHARQRLHIDFISLDDPNAAERVYQESVKFVHEAAENGTCSIRAVNSFVELFVESDNKAAEQRRTEYLTAIEEKIGKVDYHRLIQLPDVPDHRPIQERFASAYLKHFKTILDRKKNVPTELLLDVVAARYPISFVIIDNKGGNNFLIWQINEYVRTESTLTEKLKLHGVFLVKDPDERIIRFFKGWFKNLEKCESRRAVTPRDLGIENSQSVPAIAALRSSSNPAEPPAKPA